MKLNILFKKSTLLVLLSLGLTVAGFYFIFFKIEKTGRISYDFISGGSVLYEVFIADDGSKYLLSWKGHNKSEDNLRSISTDLSYLPPFGDLNLMVKGYRGLSLFPVNLSDLGYLPKLVMTDYQVLNTIKLLPSKNTYICLGNDNKIESYYIYNQQEQRSGSMGPTNFELIFPDGEEERLIDLLKQLIDVNENCKNISGGCDGELYLRCSRGTSSAIRLNASGKGYFLKNSIKPQFIIDKYEINDLKGAYSNLIKDFKNE